MKNLSYWTIFLVISSSNIQYKQTDIGVTAVGSYLEFVFSDSYQGDSLKIVFPGESFYYSLDSNRKITIDKKLPDAFFAYCILPKKSKVQSLKLVLSPRENLTVIMDSRGKIKYKGSLKLPNEYLIKSDRMYSSMRSKLYTSIYADDTIQSYHFSFFNDYENRVKRNFADYNKDQTCDPCLELVYKENLAGLQFSRQEYLGKHEYPESERKFLEEKLAMDKYSLLKDSILLQANSSNIKNFLINNNDYRIYNYTNITEIENPEKRQEEIALFIQQDTATSDQVKEFLIFNFIMTNVRMNIYPELTTNVFEEFRLRSNQLWLTNKIELAISKTQELYLKNFVPFKVIKEDSSVIAFDGSSDSLTLIDVWASNCVPCIKGIKRLSSLKKSYPSTRVICINTWDDFNTWKLYLTSLELECTHYLEFEDELSKTYLIGALPRYLLVAPGGKIIGSFVDFEAMEKCLTKALEE